MPKPARIPVKAAADVLQSISTRLPAQPSPRLGAYIASVVKDPRRLAALRADPARALRAAAIDPAGVDPARLLKVVEGIVGKIIRPGDVMDTVTTKETSSHQERNFDNSASWFYNKDGYNVMYDQGHSSEKSSGEMVGQDHKFDGLEIIPSHIRVLRSQMAKLFFPSQPLVSPALIEHIKQSAGPR